MWRSFLPLGLLGCATAREVPPPRPSPPTLAADVRIERIASVDGLTVAYDGAGRAFSARLTPSGTELVPCGATWDTYCGVRGERGDPLVVPDARAVIDRHDLACVLTREGAARCWNHRGDRPARDFVRSAAPDLTVDAPGGVASLTFGGDQACAVHADGSVSCARRPTQYDPPESVTGPFERVRGVEGATSVSPTSDGAACAVTLGGRVTCWGSPWLCVRPARADVGEFLHDDGPCAVAGAEGAVQVATHEHRACALRADGSVVCWGQERRGLRGHGVCGPFATEPTLVPGLSDVVAITESPCALRRDGRVLCWGFARTQYTWAADVSLLARLPEPRRVGGLVPAVELAAGLRHTCARSRDGAVWCWGHNGVGQLADRAIAGGPRPRAVALPEAVEGLVASSCRTCAWRRDGRLWCWGAACNDFSTRTAGGASEVVELPPLASGRAEHHLRSGGFDEVEHLDLDADGRWWSWREVPGEAPEAPLALTAPDPTWEPLIRRRREEVAHGVARGERTWQCPRFGCVILPRAPQHTCELDAEGGVWCRGENADGQAGAVEPFPQVGPR